MPDEGLEVTPISEWRQNRGELIKLPSGKVIKMIRTMDILLLLKNNLIPNPLSEIFEEMVAKGEPHPNRERMQGDTLLQMAEFIEDNVIKCLVFPKVYPVPKGENRETWQPDDENGVSIADLSWEDKNFIFSVAQGGATDMESFREGQKAYLASLANGQQVAPTAVAPNRATKRAAARKQPAPK